LSGTSKKHITNEFDVKKICSFFEKEQIVVNARFVFPVWVVEKKAEGRKEHLKLFTTKKYGELLFLVQKNWAT